MYACVCHAVTEDQVRSCSEQGLRHVVSTTRAGSGCGSCVARLRGLCAEQAAVAAGRLEDATSAA
ncbi:MAG TPA: (2Fe-2S)-binding protein [Mycobacteriales bacterium]